MFEALRTQWRVGSGGVVGLDYSAIHPVLRLLNVKRAEWPGIFEDIRVMESAARSEINKER